MWQYMFANSTNLGDIKEFVGANPLMILRSTALWIGNGNKIVKPLTFKQLGKIGPMLFPKGTSR
jgi:hypothetical protein